MVVVEDKEGPTPSQKSNVVPLFASVCGCGPAPGILIASPSLDGHHTPTTLKVSILAISTESLVVAAPEGVQVVFSKFFDPEMLDSRLDALWRLWMAF